MNPNSNATEAEVVVTLDRSEIIHNYNITSANMVIITGNVTCNIDGIGKDFQEVRVNLRASNQRSWSNGVAPSDIIFTENGVQSINLSFCVPDKVYNRTENEIEVKGSWDTYQSVVYATYSSGDVVSDSVKVTVYRKSHPIHPGSKSGPLGESMGLDEVLGWPCILSLIMIPTVIVIVIVFYFFRRKRKIVTQ